MTILIQHFIWTRNWNILYLQDYYYLRNKNAPSENQRKNYRIFPEDRLKYKRFLRMFLALPVSEKIHANYGLQNPWCWLKI